MNARRFDDLLQRFHRNPGANVDAIRAAESTLGSPLPEDYTAFLHECNGGQGRIGDAYVVLFEAEKLAEMNRGYGFHELTPRLILIGSDGAGEGFAFDTRTNPWPVVTIPFIGLELEYAEVVGASFDAFLENLTT